MAFGHQAPYTPIPQHEQGWSIYRVKPYRPYWENEKPEKIVDISGMVQRVTWFPDNKRLLVWHSKGLDIVNAEDKRTERLALPLLHDPDLPSGKPLVLKDVTLNPSGTHLLFSGFRWSGDAKDAAGWYIYRCRLDGSGIQRLTAVEDQPVPSYVFPATGQSALDFAKEKVRRELHEKARKESK